MHRCAALALSAALAAAATASAPAPPPVVVPTDGMRIAASARFAAGTYALPPLGAVTSTKLCVAASCAGV